MSGTDWRALCEELVDELEFWRPQAEVPDCLARARTALAQPEPEVAELTAALRNEAIDCTCTTMTSGDLRRIADLLERQAAPVPVAVSERLPHAAWQVASAASVAKDHGKSSIAAALRAAAYQVAPARPSLDSCCEHWEQGIRHKLHAITAELEAANA